MPHRPFPAQAGRADLHGLYRQDLVTNDSSKDDIKVVMEITAAALLYGLAQKKSMALLPAAVG